MPRGGSDVFGFMPSEVEAWSSSPVRSMITLSMDLLDMVADYRGSFLQRLRGGVLQNEDTLILRMIGHIEGENGTYEDVATRSGSCWKEFLYCVGCLIRVDCATQQLGDVAE